MVGSITIVRPNSMLTDIVEAIWDWQVTDGAAAQTLRGLRLPSASPLFVVHYRAPMWSDWPLSSGHHRQVVIGIQTRLTVLRPSGPVGCVTVRLRPEAAARLTGAAIAEFVDAKIELNDLFDSGEVALLEQKLIRAADSAERIVSVETFLMRHLRDPRSNPVVSRALLLLRQRPTLPMRSLASDLGVSERHLLRSFYAMVGVSPKKFARIVRLGKVLAARRRGLGWAEIAFACGFTDQAHMIKDFNALVGVSPEEFLRTTLVEKYRDLNASLGASDFYNQFLV